MSKWLLYSVLFCLLAQGGFAQKQQMSSDSIRKVYSLGEVTVCGLHRSKNQSEVTKQQMDQFNRDDLAAALKILPGVNITNVGGRNEAMLYLRGFDLREVPIYADGIPVYVPYDGYIDLSRFTTYDVAQIAVSKGFTSILYGSNTLGGAVNIVSARPVKPFEADLKAGIKLSSMGVNGYYSSLNVGSKHQKYYLSGNISYLRKDFLSLSDDFKAVKGENGGKRDNSQSKDFKASAKIGYTPNKTDEYTLSISTIKADKGVPVYAGTNSTQGYRYWRYPEWNKSSLYLIGRKAISDNSYLKANAYYDKYINGLNAYDDSTYTTQKKSSSWKSHYDDYTAGGAVEFGTEVLKSNVLKLAVQEKYDVHREHNEGEKVRSFIDNTFSAGVEDTYNITKMMRVVGGLSYNVRSAIKAQDYLAKKDSVFNFNTYTESAFNYQLAGVFQFTSAQSVSLSASHKTRFPTLKDRYSYKLGKAIPNPSLKPECGWNFELNYTATLCDHLQLETSFFLNELKDAIQQVDNVQPGKYQMQNVGDAEYKGVELQLGWQPINTLSTGASYSYIERDNKTNPAVKFTDVPKHKLFAYSQVDVSGLSSYYQISAEYNSMRISTSDGKYTAPAYFLLNSKIHSTISAKWSVEALVNNIFDKNYCIVEGYPEEGRTFQLNAKYSF